MPEEKKEEEQKQEENKQEGQKGSDKEEKKQEEKKDDGVNITIDGQTRMVTQKELIELAQKSGGADKRFREAAEASKKAEKWETVGELFTKVSDPKQEASKEEIALLATHLGLNPTDLDAFLKKEEEDGDRKKGKEAEKKRLALEDLPDEIQVILAGAKKNQIEAAIAEVKADVKKALDKDEIIGKIVIDSGDTGSLKEALSEMIFEDVQRRILGGEQYGPELVAIAVQKARARLGKFSTRGKKEDGLNLGILGLGPSGKLPAEVQADKPIDRVSSTDPKYESNFLSRFQQQMIKALRSKG
jgi:hypothetical protein